MINHLFKPGVEIPPLDIVAPDGYDVIGYWLHYTAHALCRQMWVKCPTIKSTIDPSSLDLFEDLYGIHLLRSLLIDPSVADLSAECVERCHQLHGSLDNSDVKLLKGEINHPIINWLTSKDVTQQQTFNQYALMWAKVFRVGGVW